MVKLYQKDVNGFISVELWLQDESFSMNIFIFVGKNKVLMMRSTVLGLIFAFLFISPLYTFSGELNFTRISSESSYSRNTVCGVVEDNNGFIWAGTLDGLNRYDGYKMINYRPQSGDPGSLPDHRIKQIIKDKAGFLWIRNYENEFSCYDPVKENFTNFSAPDSSRNNYVGYLEAGNGDIWLWGNDTGAMRISRKESGVLEETLWLANETHKNVCNFLLEDSQGTIWMGGETGLYRVLPSGKTEEFYKEEKPSLQFTGAVEHLGKIWFITDAARIVKYDIKQRHFELISTLDEATLWRDITVYAPNELLLISRDRGVFIMNGLTHEIHRPDWMDHSESAANLRLVTDREKGVWLHSNRGNIWYHNYQTDRIKRMNLVPEEVANTTGYSFFIDSTGQVWIITYGNGLYTYDPHKDLLTHYKSSPDNNSLPSDYLLSIAEDRFGNIWLGTEYAGLVRVVKAYDYIRTIRPEKNISIGKSNNVRALYEDAADRIWVGTKNGSLYVYDADLKEGKCIAENINPYTITEDRKQRIWVGTKGNGIFVYDSGSYRQLHHFISDETTSSSLSNNVVFHIIADNENRIWIGTFGGGINLVEEINGKFIFRHFIKDAGNKSAVRCLYQDSRGLIWVGSSDGVMRFDPEEIINLPDRYVLFQADPLRENSLSNNDIKVIYEDYDHTVWIGTAGGGLNRFVTPPVSQDGYFINYTRENGLSDNFVMGILEHHDELWISSENGISRMHKESESFMTYHFSDKPYENNFNEGAYLKCRNGNMLWGSLDGILLFNPETFAPEAAVPEVKLTGFHVEGAEPGTKGYPLNKSITYTDMIKLDYNQNTFTVEFASLILRNPEKNTYTYLLEGYDKQWSKISHSNSATYKNLPPGKYLFRVKGANHDGVWSEYPTQLEIVVTPPFWKSAIAYVFYIILFLSILYAVMSIMVKIKTLHNKVEMEQQLTNHKLRFFTNISHEFRTPLTLIRGAVENLNEVKGLDSAVIRQLHILNRNSGNLSRLIDELLEFRKIQNNALVLNLQQVDIVAFVGERYASFSEMAKQREITYLFTPAEATYDLYIDCNKVDKIINNLLSNAFKFTPRKGRIELRIEIDTKEESCILSVADNGMGIPKEKQELLFSRFMQVNFSSGGTGVGLSLVKEFAEVHKGKVWFEPNPEGGSVFSVALPISGEVYQGENFIRLTHPDVLDQEDGSVPEDQLSTEEVPEIEDQVLAGYTLLIIDDNDDIRNFLSDEFSRYLKTDTAEDGESGLKKAMETNPDIIICDVMMPQMDGFEVTRQLKQEFQTCHIPIILLTAHSSVEHQLEGIESGADAYITKPFSLKYIVARVLKLIEQRERLKKRFSDEFVVDGNLITATDKDKVFFELIESILDQHLLDPNFTINQFAEMSGLRRTVFYKKVKGVTGYSPNELIKLKRLKKAAIFLAENRWTVSEVAYKVGFEDPYYFSKCFKAQFQCSPSKYIELLEGKQPVD